jgi:hypothetical protein
MCGAGARGRCNATAKRLGNGRVVLARRRISQGKGKRSARNLDEPVAIRFSETHDCEKRPPLDELLKERVATKIASSAERAVSVS